MNIDKGKINECHKHHSPIKHILHMILCCGLPLVILLVLPYIALFSPRVAVLLGIIAPFICPLMMGGMIFMMFKGGKNSKKRNAYKEMMKSEKESRTF